MLGNEVQVFGGAVEGKGFLGTVLWAELAKADAVILNKPLGLIPFECLRAIDRLPT